MTRYTWKFDTLRVRRFDIRYPVFEYFATWIFDTSIVTYLNIGIHLTPMILPSNQRLDIRIHSEAIASNANWQSRRDLKPTAISKPSATEPTETKQRVQADARGNIRQKFENLVRFHFPVANFPRILNYPGRELFSFECRGRKKLANSRRLTNFPAREFRSSRQTAKLFSIQWLGKKRRKAGEAGKKKEEKFLVTGVVH